MEPMPLCESLLKCGCGVVSTAHWANNLGFKCLHWNVPKGILAQCWLGRVFCFISKQGKMRQKSFVVISACLKGHYSLGLSGFSKYLCLCFCLFLSLLCHCLAIFCILLKRYKHLTGQYYFDWKLEICRRDERNHSSMKLKLILKAEKSHPANLTHILLF